MTNLHFDALAPPPTVTPFTFDDVEPTVRESLRKPFPPEQIGRIPASNGRPPLDFVGHAAVTDRLNKVAPGWTYGILERFGTGNSVWVHGWIQVGGIRREEYGDGKDPKEAIGNFIRRAAMRFGVAIDLWSREELETSDGERAVSEQRGQHQRRPSAPPSAEEAVLPTSAALAEGTTSGGGDGPSRQRFAYGEGVGGSKGSVPPSEPNDPGGVPTHPGPDAAPRLGDAAPSSPGSTKPKPHKDHRPDYDVAPNEHGVVPCAEPGCKAFVKLDQDGAS